MLKSRAVNSKCCPKCGSEDHLIKSRTILITLEEFDWVAVFVLAIALAGALLNFSFKETIAFIAVGLIPVCCKLRQRFVCQKCDILFSAEREKSTHEKS